VSIARGDLYLTDSLLSIDQYLKEDKLRQLVLLNILKEEYYSNYLPKSGILSLLEQISNNSIIAEHAQIAENLLINFNTASVGFRFPEIVLKENKDSILLSSIKGKYIYVHAFDPRNPTCIKEIGALKKLYDKYGKQIEFVTIYPAVEKAYSKIEQRNLDALNWKKSSYKLTDPIWKKLQIISFPYYLLIDDSYYLLSSPALSPIPNGNYQTIEKILYDIIHQNDKE
jgi:thiol-disulfide isomerase/thioredoxin